MNQDNFQIKDIPTKNNFGQTQSEIPKQQKLGLISLFTKKNLPKTLAVIVIISILIAVAAIIWGRHSFSRAKVDIEAKISEDVASGKEATLIVKYKNKNRVNLNDAYLIIDYPSGTFSLEGKEIFQEQRDLGTILRKSEGQAEFKIRFIGEKGDVKNLSLSLNYQPQNISSRFENSSSLRVEISSVLIDLNIQGSEKTISGHEVSYIIEYENKTDEDISNLRLEIEFSEGFEFEGDNFWEIGLLKAREKGTIELKGALVGEEGESKILKATIGKVENDNFLQYSQLEYITQIAPSPLLVFLEIEGAEEKCIINAGQKLNYKIRFGNNTDIALRELVLKAYFEDNIFDFKSLNLAGVGFFDSRENTITWSGAEVPILNLLEPNQSGGVSFSVEIKESLPIVSYSDKNFQARVLAEIGTLTVPPKFAVSELKVKKELSCKINSQLDLDTKVYYYEPESSITNTGPIPPRVDQLTTYTVHWQIANTSNDLKNVKVWAILPQGIEWLNHYINNVSGSRVSYNERTKEITWEIDRVPAGIGVRLPVYEFIFQIGLRPSINQVNQIPTLIHESSAEGEDMFTGKNLKDFTPEVSTSLPDDPQVSSGQGRVVE